MRRPLQQYARELSRLNRSDRLLRRALKRCSLEPKAKYQRHSGDLRRYDVGTDGAGKERLVNQLPAEWR